MFFQHSSAKDSSRRASHARVPAAQFLQNPRSAWPRSDEGGPRSTSIGVGAAACGWLSAACGWLSACGGPSAGLWLCERCGQSCTPSAARESPAPSPGRSPDTPESQPSACQSTQSDRLCATANQPVGSTPSNTLLLGTCSPIGQSSRNRGCTTGPAPRQA